MFQSARLTSFARLLKGAAGDGGSRSSHALPLRDHIKERLEVGFAINIA